MQIPALPIILRHLEATFCCDREEMRGLLSLLSRALTDAAEVLSGTDAERIYHCSHQLHSELHSCGYADLSDLAMQIELQARQGSIDRAGIDELLIRSASLRAEIDDWMDGGG